MVEGKLAQDAFSARGEPDFHHPAILLAAMPAHQLPRLEPVNQLDGAVMLELDPVGKLSDRCRTVFGQAFQSQQQLVLLGLEPGATRGLLAQIQEAPNLITKLGERLVIRTLHKKDLSLDIYRLAT